MVNGRAVAQRHIAFLLAGAEAYLIGIRGDDFSARAQVHLARYGIYNYGVSDVHTLDDAGGLADSRDAERLGNNGDVALARTVLDNKAAQLGAVVIEQFGWAHGPRDEDRVRRHRALVVGAG